jgi:hypothetical protein
MLLSPDVIDDCRQIYKEPFHIHIQKIRGVLNARSFVGSSREGASRSPKCEEGPLKAIQSLFAEHFNRAVHRIDALLVPSIERPWLPRGYQRNVDVVFGTAKRYSVKWIILSLPSGGFET